tara:strand:+ start:274935 stop:275237 length:303 start_codon:yes stop_codon:yes gene_type:complete
MPLKTRWLFACLAGAAGGAIAGAVLGLLMARGNGVAMAMLLGALPGIVIGLLAAGILLGLLFAVNVLGARTWTDMECVQVGTPAGAIATVAFAVLAEALG